MQEDEKIVIEMATGAGSSVLEGILRDFVDKNSGIAEIKKRCKSRAVSEDQIRKATVEFIMENFDDQTTDNI